MSSDNEDGPEKMITVRSGDAPTVLVVPLAMAQAVFDIAVGSMDFGSGFLDHDEVEKLRAFAVLIGVDPMLATPDNFKCQYTGGHQWEEKTERYQQRSGSLFATSQPKSPLVLNIETVTRTCTKCRTYELISEHKTPAP